MIYFVRCNLTERVKIGFSERPWLRLVKMQADCPVELELVAIIEGDKAAEAALHERFRDLRVRGEWFAESGDLSSLIKSLPVAERPATKKHRARRAGGNRLCKWISDHGLTDREVGEAVGVQASTILRLRRGDRIPRLDLARRISAFTAVPWLELFFDEAA